MEWPKLVFQKKGVAGVYAKHNTHICGQAKCVKLITVSYRIAYLKQALSEAPRIMMTKCLE